MVHPRDRASGLYASDYDGRVGYYYITAVAKLKTQLS